MSNRLISLGSLRGIGSKSWMSMALFTLIGFSEVVARPLPQWSPEDRVRIQKGELVAGASLLVDSVPHQPTSGVQPQPVIPVPTPIEPIDPLESDPGYDERLIPEEYLADYFSKSPVTYLIDPQRLFSNQETLDREGFLEYCADESEVDVRVYLFGGEQEIPDGYTLKRLIKDQYANEPLTAVVFYFLGNPKRNQLMFGGRDAERVDSEKLRKMLNSAQIKALEKSDPAAQMESFIVQLSISIYWVEQAMAETRAAEATQIAVAGSTTKEGETANSSAGALEKIRPYLLYAAVGILSVISIMLALVSAWVLWRRSRRYRFPVLDLPCRLGADYAAGIGAVICFHNKLDSPSSQRDKIPGYLTKL